MSHPRYPGPEEEGAKPDLHEAEPKDARYAMEMAAIARAAKEPSEAKAALGDQNGSTDAAPPD